MLRVLQGQMCDEIVLAAAPARRHAAQGLGRSYEAHRQLQALFMVVMLASEVSPSSAEHRSPRSRHQQFHMPGTSCRKLT